MINGSSSSKSLLRSHEPWVSCARICWTSWAAKPSITGMVGTGVMVAVSVMSGFLFLEIERPLAPAREYLAQPRRRGARDHLLRFGQHPLDGLGLGDLHRVDVFGPPPRRARAANRRHHQNGNALERLQLWRQLVLVAI